MILHSDMRISPESDCPYLENRKWRTNYFFASGLSADELEFILSKGWRKFGMYYFRPACRDCDECVPIRLLTGEMNVSKSMKRVLRRCREIRVEFNEPEYRDEIYEIYKKHSLVRFDKTSSQSDFLHSFYTLSCPSIQSEYFLDDRLIATGFLDVSSTSLSSVYFIYDTDYMNYRLGTFSIIREAAYGLERGLNYYYLGYYVKENRSMAYKNCFHINEKMDWTTGIWINEKTAGDDPAPSSGTEPISLF